jgi:hypothetical protein
MNGLNIVVTLITWPSYPLFYLLTNRTPIINHQDHQHLSGAQFVRLASNPVEWGEKIYVQLVQW